MSFLQQSKKLARGGREGSCIYNVSALLMYMLMLDTIWSKVFGENKENIGIAKHYFPAKVLD